MIKTDPLSKRKEDFFINEQGILNGKYSKWDSHGHLLLEWNFCNGKKHGEQINYWETGQKSVVANYYYGIPDGYTTYFKPTGDYISIANYKKGTLIFRKECPDYSKPTSLMLHTFMESSGVDSITADSLLRANFAGYILKTDSGVFIKEDPAVIAKMDSLKQLLKRIRAKQRPMKD